MADEAVAFPVSKIEGQGEPSREKGSAPSRPAPRPWTFPSRGLAVFHGCGETARLSHYFLPRLLMEGKRILFLDGANSADPRLLARLARERGVAFAQFSRQIQIARAFTCFQLTELIARVPRFLADFPAQVLVVTALPDLYFDGDIRDWDARVAFERALADLRRYGRGEVHAAGRRSETAATKAGTSQAASDGPAQGRLKETRPPLQLAVAVFSSSSDFAPAPSRKRFFQQTCAAATEEWKFASGEQGRAKLLCLRRAPVVSGPLPVAGSSQSTVDS
jgi:hypothetical protein